MTIKESYDVVGMPTTWGLPELKDNRPARNALAVDRLLAAGVVLFGKTNVPAWLADWQSYNAIYGTTNSPWNPKLVPGGSSGGATAALAAGLTGIEMGSDIAGSIRNPAAVCGVFGHKPTMGVCPTDGHALNENVAPLDILAIGPLARSADDLALGLSILAGPDDIDAAGTRLALPPPKKMRLRDFKVGVVLDHPTAPVDREVSGLIQKLADFLSKQKAKVSDTARPDIDLHEAHQVFDVLLRAATSARLSDDEQQAFRDELAALPPGTDTKRSRMLRGNTISHRDWLRLNERRHRMRHKWRDWFRDYDLLLCPVLCTAALPHDQRPPYERTITVNGKEYAANNQLFWSGYSCVSYLPATAAPIGFTKDGRPVGVQIVGPQYGDRTCIAFARLLEKEYQPFVAPPGFG
jgi:amidase